METKKYVFRTTLTISSVIALALIALIKDQSFYSSIREKLGLNSRVVLSSVSGEVIPNSYDTKILKIKTEEGIYLEIYRKENDNFALIQRIELGKQDAYFSFFGKSSNLALDDVDGDLIKEIIVPIYDQELVAHLQVLKYDLNSKSFIRL